jgi:hypothetical protein
LRADGWLILEDADGLLFDADPAENAFTAIAGPWQRAAAATGWNPCYGRYLVADLQRAGLGRVAGRAHRDYQPEGCLARLTSTMSWRRWTIQSGPSSGRPSSPRGASALIAKRDPGSGGCPRPEAAVSYGSSGHSRWGGWPGPV